MFLARVCGTVVSTVKDDALAAHKLLLVRPVTRDGRDAGRALVALDAVGAGAGEFVYCCRSKEASFAFTPPGQTPTDATIVGIADPAANAFLKPKEGTPA
ncbi:MAG TPA: EutN/CcmL family microcompartment protein [Terriglobales bacterium]|nr:EutN/CcmL family microcompartment protein [Terriglobales bacterium]